MWETFFAFMCGGMIGFVFGFWLAAMAQSANEQDTAARKVLKDAGYLKSKAAP